MDDKEKEASPSVMIPPELVEVIRVGVRANREVPGSVARSAGSSARSLRSAVPRWILISC